MFTVFPAEAARWRGRITQQRPSLALRHLTPPLIMPSASPLAPLQLPGSSFKFAHIGCVWRPRPASPKGSRGSTGSYRRPPCAGKLELPGTRPPHTCHTSRQDESRARDQRGKWWYILPAVASVLRHTRSAEGGSKVLERLRKRSLNHSGELSFRAAAEESHASPQASKVLQGAGGSTDASMKEGMTRDARARHPHKAP
ncbi:hypothetical protein E2C01_047503 [Portunus trituberculatus]|uniref:Uncharacterized protein n=1 Tax=Portunus trituberculatus TaxID=210409 RepID=A0A5B7G3S0_PORTR|nr:hypothetical protein [Portunus trituberculatus]